MRVVTFSRLSGAVLACLVGAALLLPLAGAATGQVEVMGRIVIEHGDDFDNQRAVPYTVLVAGSERYTIEGEAARGLKEGQRVRVRGTRVGGRIVLGRDSSVTSFSTAAEGGASMETASSPEASSTTSTATVTKKVAVLLINFVAPPPTPTPSPSPTPVPTPEPTPSAQPTATAEPSPSVGTDDASPSSPPEPTPTPTASPSATPPPTPTPSPTPTPQPPPQPWTVDQVRSIFFTNPKSAASYFDEVSNGRIAMSGEVFGWYTLVHDTATCDFNGWASAAKTAARNAGVDLSTYTNFVYAFPKVNACYWGGLGNINGPNSWINGKVKMNLYVTTHELGHNFGTHHAATLSCRSSSGARVAYSSSCVTDEYGDPFDIMGGTGSYSHTYHLNNYNRKLVGALSAADHQQTVSINGIYRVANAQANRSGPRILRVLRPAGDYWYLEHRQPYGLFDTFATTSAVVNGVSIRLAPNWKRIPPQLIDTTPETSSFYDAPLAVGRTFTDPHGGISVTTLALDAKGATVRIQVGPDIVPPGAPPALAATVSGPEAITVSWSAASDDLEVVGYIVHRDGVEIARPTGRTFVDEGLAQVRDYAYTVRAVDGAGNVGKAASVSIYLPDSYAPGAPAAIAGSQTAERQVSLSWGEATDNIGVVGYRIFRNGKMLVETNALSLDDATVVDGWTYRYAVRAVDAAGNLGEPVTYEVSLPDVTPPTPPGSMSTGIAAAAKLSWTPATDNVAVAGYTVSRDGVVVATVDGNTTALIESDLADGTYAYRVIAFDAAGHVSLPLDTTLTVLSADVTPPSVPTGVTTKSRKWRYIDISWQPSADDRAGTIRYVLFRNRVRIARLTGTMFTDRPARVGTYRYKVRAVDAARNRSAFSAKVLGEAVRRLR